MSRTAAVHVVACGLIRLTACCHRRPADPSSPGDYRAGGRGIDATGYQDDEMLRCDALGCDSFVAKPV